MVPDLPSLLPEMRRKAEVEHPLTGAEIAAVSEWFRYSLFRVGTLIALGLVALAVVLSFTRRHPDPIATAAAAVILAVPLAAAVVWARDAWRLVLRRPWTLLAVGPLIVIAGTVGDRSALYYPGLLWVIGAAIAGGVRWSVLCVVVFTLGTTSAGLLAGELDVHQALEESLTVIGPRLVLALITAGLFEGLAQIVWLHAAAAGQPEIARTSTARPVSERPDGPPGPARNETVAVIQAAEVADQFDPTREALPRPIEPRPQASVSARLKPVSDLERAVLEVMADGKTVAEAAQQLGIPARTARARIERAFARNGFHSATAMIRWAAENGLLPEPPERPDGTVEK